MTTLLEYVQLHGIPYGTTIWYRVHELKDLCSMLRTNISPLIQLAGVADWLQLSNNLVLFPH